VSEALRDHELARSYSDERHVLFVPAAAGYRLIERTGAVPAPGEDVRLSGGTRFRVLRVGPSPLPGSRIACAYLEPFVS
jgi:hypothetical protein